MDQPTTQSFSSATEAERIANAAWDEKHAEITVDNVACSLEDLAKVKTATSISILGANSHIKLADDLQVKNLLMIYHCRGKIALGKNTTVGGLAIDACSGIASLPENLTCASTLVVSNCNKFQKIGAGLVINPRKHSAPDGVIGLRVNDCPQFQKLEGPAIVNGFLAFYNVPAFTGLVPDIEHDSQHLCLYDGINKSGDRTESDAAREKLRDLYRQSLTSATPEPAQP